ncbi:hypothetical protein M011DRAFT_461045 [Sporormia fimetaria CBS 119925]|uniref:Uncharacterized protein n=1 Tax=Sporormia fimetaria CBS 119925 TaxID=1340428 RepID=A0A6A6V3T3_9PLEO|nr:hypothetical protein M011DRAFT_461045 [Sporormia fimetaria CBS 119925]
MGAVDGQEHRASRCGGVSGECRGAEGGPGTGQGSRTWRWWRWMDQVSIFFNTGATVGDPSINVGTGPCDDGKGLQMTVAEGGTSANATVSRSRRSCAIAVWIRSHVVDAAIRKGRTGFAGAGILRGAPRVPRVVPGCFLGRPTRNDGAHYCGCSHLTTQRLIAKPRERPGGAATHKDEHSVEPHLVCCSLPAATALCRPVAAGNPWNKPPHCLAPGQQMHGSGHTRPTIDDGPLNPNPEARVPRAYHGEVKQAQSVGKVTERRRRRQIDEARHRTCPPCLVIILTSDGVQQRPCIRRTRDRSPWNIKLKTVYLRQLRHIVKCISDTALAQDIYDTSQTFLKRPEAFTSLAAAGATIFASSLRLQSSQNVEDRIISQVAYRGQSEGPTMTSST